VEGKVVEAAAVAAEKKSQWMEQLEFLRALKELIKKEAEEIAESSHTEDPYQSPKTNELNAARAKAALDYPKIGFNQENPYFKSSYTDLDGIMMLVRPVLAKHGLSVEFKTVIKQDGSTELRTRLLHSSDQWSETRARIIPTKNDQQSYASALTYMKRHQAMALLNITISDDWSDDDAERNMAPVRDGAKSGTAINTKYNPKEQSGSVITKEQLDELEYELGEFPDIAQMVLDGLKIESLADMPKSKFQVSAQRIREIKNARLGVK
jgi:hypothetical protein